VIPSTSAPANKTPEIVVVRVEVNPNVATNGMPAMGTKILKRKIPIPTFNRQFISGFSVITPRSLIPLLPSGLIIFFLPKWFSHLLYASSRIDQSTVEPYSAIQHSIIEFFHRSKNHPPDVTILKLPLLVKVRCWFLLITA
jgi:hypothetical protein